MKEKEEGKNVEEICRKKGVRDERIYKWKEKLGGMEV